MNEKRKSKFVNGNRTLQERRTIYCMFRKLFDMSRIETRVVCNFRKSNQIRYIKQVGTPSYTVPGDKCLSKIYGVTHD